SLTGTQVTLEDGGSIDLNTIKISDLAVPNQNVNWNNFSITNLNSPVGPSDAATKQYVDTQVSGIPIIVSTGPSISGDGSSPDPLIVADNGITTIKISDGAVT
ncbi:hypothetical protein, partial [Fulvivirga aurantia]|uniref:hypothetical protein n=1 Tax=Fulvivirga aurantia TaxID=2529383 RepID=UPI001CA410E0